MWMGETLTLSDWLTVVAHELDDVDLRYSEKIVLTKGKQRPS